MNRSTPFARALSLMALAAASGAALADDITMADPSFMSTLTRAEVHAQVLQAQADGTLFQGGEITVVAPAPASSAAPTHVKVDAREVQAQLASLYLAG